MVAHSRESESPRNWHSLAFYAAGGLLLIAAGVEATNALTPATIPPSVDGLAGFGGILLAMVGLLGLYPRLADGAPRLARTGVALVALPVTFVSALFAKNVLAEFVAVPSLTAVVPSLGLVTGAVFLLFAVGVALFGVVGLRTDVLSDPAGSLLLVFAAGWIVFLAAIPLYGFPIPHGVTVVASVTQGGALVGIGQQLRISPEPAERTAPAPGSTA